jgi:hypothetical protein
LPERSERTIFGLDPPCSGSGASIGYQPASIIAGGPAPFVSTWLFSTYHSSLPIALYVSVCAAISICAALLLPDQANMDISHGVHYGNA